MSRFPNLSKLGFEMPAGAKLSASYNAASTTRRMGSWGTSISGPNSSNASLSTVRSRSRQMSRNNEYARSGLESYVANLIGTGIRPRWNLDKKSIKEELLELWNDWTDEADFTGMMDLYGIQELIGRTEFQSGEAFCQLLTRPLSEGLTVPLQLKVFEPDMCDATYNRLISNRVSITNGIEISNSGKRLGYWLYRNHPGDTAGFFHNGGDMIRIPAENMLHVFLVDRPGQLRGVPRLAPILLKLYELDQYTDAELLRKKTAAMFAAFVTKDSGNANPLSSGIGDTTDGETTADDVPITSLEPGMIQFLLEGEDVKFSEPADVGGNFEAWIKHELHGVAAAIGTTYEQLTGDLKGVNYTSIRAGVLEFRRRIKMRQANTISFQFCRAVGNRFVDLAVASGAIKIRDFVKKPKQYKRITWQAPGWDWVDPLKDQMADQAAVRNGFKTRAEVVSAISGRDVENIDDERRQELDREEELALVFDSNPNATNKSGNLQKAEQNEVDEAMINDEDEQDQNRDSNEPEEKDENRQAAGIY